MKATNLVRAIIARGGTAKIKETKSVWSDGSPRIISEVSGILNNHDIHMSGNNGYDASFFTTRPIDMRGYDDPGSDYNPGGYIFCRRIKDLDWATK